MLRCVLLMLVLASSNIHLNRTSSCCFGLVIINCLTIYPFLLCMHIRGHLPNRVDYIYAAATDIDSVDKTLNCEHHAADGICKKFKVPYDMLVVGTGATTNTFNTKGVDEYCHFLKQTGDATLIRDKVLENLEVASLPGTSDEERSKLLSVYVVGGGPTGVEFAAELQDFLMDDVVNPKHAIYKRCAGSTSVTVVQSNAHLLPGYQSAVQDCAEENLKEIGVNILTNTRVIGISKNHISVMDKPTGEKSDLPYGLVVWATGVSPIPLAKSLISKLPEQDSHRAIRTNSRCQVLGAEDSIFAVGDCADVTIEKEYKDYTLQFYRQHMKDSGGSDRTGLSEEANIAFVEGLKSHFETHGGVTGYKVQGQIIQEKLIADFAKLLETAKTRKSSFKGLKEADVDKIVANRLKRQTFHPPTAQVAHQQGEFLASMLNEGVYVPDANGGKGKWSFDHVDPFSFNNMGQMVYLGGHIAAMTIPASEEVSVDWNGTLTNTVWHGAYWGMLDSMSARCALLFDWTRGRLFGRPTSLNAICTPDSSSGEAVNMSRHARN